MTAFEICRTGLQFRPELHDVWTVLETRLTGDRSFLCALIILHIDLWLPAIAMFVLSLVVTIADRMQMLSGTRSALHDAFSPGRLALIAMQATTGSGEEANNTALSAASPTIDASNARQLKALRQLMIENARCAGI
jgi:hypothetical protein